MAESKEKILTPDNCNTCLGGMPFVLEDKVGFIGAGKLEIPHKQINQYSYPDIPICTECGGLGYTIPIEDFHNHVKNIAILRQRFFPDDGLPEPPDAVLYYSLKGLVGEVGTLTEKYGNGKVGSFASEIASGVYDRAIDVLGEGVNKQLQIVRNTNTQGEPDRDSTKPILIAHLEGRFEDGLHLTDALADKYPKLSTVQHDLGYLYLLYNRNPNAALNHFVLSTQLEPKKTLHFYQTAKLLFYIGRLDEAVTYLERAQIQPDYAEFFEEHKINIPKLLGLIYSEQNLQVPKTLLI